MAPCPLPSEPLASPTLLLTLNYPLGFSPIFIWPGLTTFLCLVDAPISGAYGGSSAKFTKWFPFLPGPTAVVLHWLRREIVYMWGFGGNADVCCCQAWPVRANSVGWVKVLHGLWGWRGWWKPKTEGSWLKKSCPKQLCDGGYHTGLLVSTRISIVL